MISAAKDTTAINVASMIRNIARIEDTADRRVKNFINGVILDYAQIICRANDIDPAEIPHAVGVTFGSHGHHASMDLVLAISDESSRRLQSALGVVFGMCDDLRGE